MNLHLFVLWSLYSGVAISGVTNPVPSFAMQTVWMLNAIKVTAFASAQPVSQQTKVFLTPRFALLADGSLMPLNFTFVILHYKEFNFAWVRHGLPCILSVICRTFRSTQGLFYLRSFGPRPSEPFHHSLVPGQLRCVCLKTLLIFHRYPQLWHLVGLSNMSWNLSEGSWLLNLWWWWFKF